MKKEKFVYAKEVTTSYKSTTGEPLKSISHWLYQGNERMCLVCSYLLDGNDPEVVSKFIVDAINEKLDREL